MTADGPKKALERRTYVLTQMAKLGTITQADADAAEKAELKVTGNRTPNGCIATTVGRLGLLLRLLLPLVDRPAGVRRRRGRPRRGRLKSSGYRIVTTLDPKAQASAKQNVEKEIRTGNSDALMLAAIEPGTGRVKAMAANRNYGLDTSGNQPSSDPAKRAAGIKGTYPTTTNPIISGGGDISGYKAGSTFKMFTMLTALEKGYPLDSPR